MTLAWYGHLKLQETGVSAKWPIIGVIAFSWGIAFFEYCCQVPAKEARSILFSSKSYKNALALQYLRQSPISCFKDRTCTGIISLRSSLLYVPFIWCL